jgi:hypothetical protein
VCVEEHSPLPCLSPLSLSLSLSQVSVLLQPRRTAKPDAAATLIASHPEKSSSAPRRRREERQVHALSREQWMHRHPHRCNSRTFVLCELSAARPVAETPFLNPRRCAASPRRWSRPEPRTMFALAPRGPRLRFVCLAQLAGRLIILDRLDQSLGILLEIDRLVAGVDVDRAGAADR